MKKGNDNDFVRKRENDSYFVNCPENDSQFVKNSVFFEMDYSAKLISLKRLQGKHFSVLKFRRQASVKASYNLLMYIRTFVTVNNLGRNLSSMQEASKDRFIVSLGKIGIQI